jgi:hypothetical protein
VLGPGQPREPEREHELVNVAPGESAAQGEDLNLHAADGIELSRPAVDVVVMKERRQAEDAHNPIHPS